MFEILIFMGVLNLAAVGVTAWSVRRLGCALDSRALELKALVVNEGDRAADEFDLTRHQNFWLHRILRSYVGVELLERRILPAIGHKELTGRAEFEKKLTDAYHKQASTVDAGTF